MVVLFRSYPALGLLLWIISFGVTAEGQTADYRIEGTLLSQESSTCTLILDHPVTAVTGFGGAFAWDPDEATYVGTTLGEDLVGFGEIGAIDFFHLSSCYPGNLNFAVILWDFNSGTQYWLPEAADDELLEMEFIPSVAGGETFDIATETNFCNGTIGELMIVSNFSIPTYLSPQTFSLEVTEPVADVHFLRGDVDANSSANIGDAVLILNYLFVTGIAPGCRDAGDCDDNGSINLGDPMNLLLRIFSGAPPLPPPFFSCGPDPTDDALDCQQPPDCI